MVLDLATNMSWEYQLKLSIFALWHCMHESWATDCWQCWLRNWNQNCWHVHGLMHVRLESCQYSHSKQLNTKESSKSGQWSYSYSNHGKQLTVFCCAVHHVFGGLQSYSPHASNYKAQQRVKRLRSHCVKIRGSAPDAPETCMGVQFVGTPVGTLCAFVIMS